MALVAEIGLRVADLFDPFDLGYYAIPDRDRPGSFHVAYGTMRINSHGYPDAEFDLGDPRPRIGYFGDSVTEGVGAGYGHRVSDHLEARYPGFQHLTLAKIGDGAQDPQKAIDLTEQFGIDRYVYMMNMNDILPLVKRPKASIESEGDDDDRGPARGGIRQLTMSSIFAAVDQLRLVSHLYNAVRMKARNALMALGISHKGLEAYEMHPQKNLEVLEATVSRVNVLHERLAAIGVPFCVVVLPYEMQISSEAETFYASRGIRWEDGFVDRTTQALLLERLDPGIEVVDAYYAFVDPLDPEGSRSRIGVGDFYVTRAGGALDWNHPNRAGHRRIADYLIERDFCGLSASDGGPARAAISSPAP